MRIKNISIENFKCFKAADFELGKLTLLTGANSSGKSSVLYSILGALQSVEFPNQFSPNGKYVNMGSFKEMVHNNSLADMIKISMTVNVQEYLFSLITYWKEDEKRKLPLNDQIETSSENFSARHFKNLYNAFDKKLNFISSFRLHPERTYYETTKTDLTVGKFGEQYIDQIILWETQKADEYDQLIKVMKSLSLFESVESRRLDGGRFELTVKVNKNSRSASLDDVGFGISQFLPIVVADLQLGDESTHCIAQPEIHLHPRVQARFGDYMVKQINQSLKNYIVETHSEYLLNLAKRRAGDSNPPSGIQQGRTNFNRT